MCKGEQRWKDRESRKPEFDEIVGPPQCKLLARISVKPRSGAYVVESQELATDVHMGNAIVEATNNYISIPLVDAAEKEFHLGASFHPKLRELSHFKIVKGRSHINMVSRTNKPQPRI